MWEEGFGRPVLGVGGAGRPGLCGVSQLGTVSSEVSRSEVTSGLT